MVGESSTGETEVAVVDAVGREDVQLLIPKTRHPHRRTENRRGRDTMSTGAKAEKIATSPEYIGNRPLSTSCFRMDAVLPDLSHRAVHDLVSRALRYQAHASAGQR